MLSLTRKANESVIIDDHIIVTVISDKRGEVRLGIEAPENITIWREENHEQLRHSDNGTILPCLCRN